LGLGLLVGLQKERAEVLAHGNPDLRARHDLRRGRDTLRSTYRSLAIAWELQKPGNPSELKPAILS